MAVLPLLRISSEFTETILKFAHADVTFGRTSVGAPTSELPALHRLNSCCDFSPAMSNRGPNGTSQSLTIAALQQALDQTYRQMLKAAQEDWQLLFAGQDPANSRVSVRTSKAGPNKQLTDTPRGNVIFLNGHKRAQRF